MTHPFSAAQPHTYSSSVTCEMELGSSVIFPTGDNVNFVSRRSWRDNQRRRKGALFLILVCSTLWAPEHAASPGPGFRSGRGVPSASSCVAVPSLAAGSCGPGVSSNTSLLQRTAASATLTHSFLQHSDASGNILPREQLSRHPGRDSSQRCAGGAPRRLLCCRALACADALRPPRLPSLECSLTLTS